MDNYISKINLDDLYEKEDQIINEKEKIYNKILLRIHKKIKHISRTKINEKYCFFAVPEFLIGTPKYDITMCIKYIIENLKNNGFNIKYTHPNLLFISWKHYINKKKRLLIKEVYGVSVDGFGNEIKKKDNNIFNINKNTIKKKEVYKNTNTYKPTGKLIYNLNLFKDIDELNRK